MTRQKGLFVTALLLCISCTTTRPVTYSLNKDAPKVCADHCQSMGMRLAAVVIIANREGCVCEPENARVASASATAASIAPILVDEEEAQRQQQQQQQHPPGTPPPPYVPPYVPPPPPTPR